MAFQLDTGASNNNNARTGTYEKAASFINFYLPSTNGGQAKLGAIGLKLSNEGEKALHEFLSGMSEEDAVTWLAQNVYFSYKQITAGSRFALTK